MAIQYLGRLDKQKWPHLTWGEGILALLVLVVLEIAKGPGRLLGEMTLSGFKIVDEICLYTMTSKAVKNEGEMFNWSQAWLLLTLYFDMDVEGLAKPDHNVESMENAGMLELKSSYSRNRYYALTTKWLNENE